MTPRLLRVYFLGGPWDLTCKMMSEEDLWKWGKFLVVRHPEKRVHTEYNSKNEAVAVFAQVTDHHYEVQQIGRETFIAVHKDIR